MDSGRHGSNYPAVPSLCILASAASLVVRFLRFGAVGREQIKWLAFAASIVGLVSSFLIPTILVPEAAGGGNPLWENLLEDAIVLSLTGIPVTVGIAILRYRLYDINIIINRAYRT